MSDLLVVQAKSESRLGEIAGAMDLDRVGTHRVLGTAQSDDWVLCENHRQNAPLAGHRTFSDDRWAAVFAGDLVHPETVPFEKILDALDSGRFEWLAHLNGLFAFAAYDSRTKRLFVVSDRRSQKPLFYSVEPQGIQVATNLALFARLSQGLEFERRWLWQALYFNFPVDETTFLRRVKRMPPACVMIFDDQSQELTFTDYAIQCKAQYPLMRGKEALRLSMDVFGTQVPLHYRGANEAACALTAGWDGRTMLALAPADEEVTAYTYGVPGCGDLVDAAATAAAAGIRHWNVPFDRSFVDDLPHRAFETVYSSGGLQGVLRSTLHHMYDALTDGGSRFPVTISGMVLGTQLRGHAQFPDLISLDLAQRFQGLGPAHHVDHWGAIFGDHVEEFKEFIQCRLEWLEKQYGRFESPEHHLNYTFYPLSTHHFCGELAIAEQFTTVRVPAWDPEVIHLSYVTGYSMLEFSQFAGRSQRVRREEMVLQSHLMKRFSPELYRVPVRGIHPATVLAGEVPYQAERAYRAIERRVRRLLAGAQAPLEAWETWLFDKNHEFVEALLRSSETQLGEYVAPTLIERTIAGRDMRILGKLLTTEIILRLIKNRWRRFW